MTEMKQLLTQVGKNCLWAEGIGNALRTRKFRSGRYVAVMGCSVCGLGVWDTSLVSRVRFLIILRMKTWDGLDPL